MSSSSRSLLPAAAAVLEDVEAVLTSQVPWEARVAANRTLRSGGTVEAWYLAMFFLRRWSCELAELPHRKSAAGARALRRTQISDRMANVALTLGFNQEIDGYIAAHIWNHSRECARWLSNTPGSDALVRSTVEAHQWCVMLAALDELSDRSGGDARRAALPSARQVLPSFCGAVHNSVVRLSASARSYVQRSLRNYRGAKRALSWMPYCQGVTGSDIVDPLFSTVELTLDTRELIAVAVRELEGASVENSLYAKPAIEWLVRAVAEQGYERFFDSLRTLADERDFGLVDEKVPMSTIPGDGAGRCSPLLLACARGGSKMGLKYLIPRVRQHLTKCGPATKGVIIVSDEWAPRSLGDSLEDLCLRAAQGVKFVFLLAVQPGDCLVHIPITLM